MMKRTRLLIALAGISAVCGVAHSAYNEIDNLSLTAVETPYTVSTGAFMISAGSLFSAEQDDFGDLYAFAETGFIGTAAAVQQINGAAFGLCSIVGRGLLIDINGGTFAEWRGLKVARASSP